MPIDKHELDQSTNSKELQMISCGYENHDAVESYGPAVRPYYILHFILSGKGYYYIGDKQYVLGPNDCFLVPPNVLTFYQADSSTPWYYAWICFDGDIVPSILQHLGLDADHPLFSYEDNNLMLQLIRQMMEHHPLTPADELYIQSRMYLIFAKLEEYAQSAYTNSQDNDNFYISAAVNYIQNNYFKDLTVDSVAKYLYISRTYLFSLFKKHRGMSPQEFLVQTKLNNAKDLLIKTNIPIAAVANSCGYHNAFAFSKAFKKAFEVTPSEYRQTHQSAT